MIGVWTNQNPFDLGLFTQDDQKQNAREILGYLQPLGWTILAVSAMLGNMQAESFVNPAQWQIGGSIEDPNPGNVEGFGLVQWTPWQNYPVAPFGDWRAGPNWRTNYLKQLDRLEYERQYDILYPNQGQWIKINGVYGYMSFDEFATFMVPESAINDTLLRNLAGYFFSSYERGTWSSIRGYYAVEWYNYLHEYGPLPPSGGHLPKWLLFKLKEGWS